METFEEWFDREPMPESYKEMARHFYLLNRELSQVAWNHQQQKIERLESDKAKLVECVRFYGSEGAYRSKHGGHIENRNFHSPIGQDCGKRARQCLKDLGIGEGE